MGKETFCSGKSAVNRYLKWSGVLPRMGAEDTDAVTNLFYEVVEVLRGYLGN